MGKLSDGLLVLAGVVTIGGIFGGLMTADSYRNGLRQEEREQDAKRMEASAETHRQLGIKAGHLDGSPRRMEQDEKGNFIVYNWDGCSYTAYKRFSPDKPSWYFGLATTRPATQRE